MRLRLVAAALASLVALPAAAQTLDIPSGTYAADRTHTSIVWKVSHLGFSVYTGMIDRAGIDATVELDAQNVAQSTLSVELGSAPALTGHPIEFDPRSIDFNDEIASPMFLNAEAEPISFKSTGIEVTGDTTAKISGELTMNGQSHELVLDTTLNTAKNHPMAGVPAFGITATGVIDRTTFGIDALAGPIGTEVAIEIQAEFFPAE
ncbi:MAG: YceI family protein [Acuticoccus sp.]